MAIRSVLLPLYGSDEELSALRYACGLAELFGARIICLHARPDLADSLDYGCPALPPCAVAGFFDTMNEENEQQLKKAKALFDETIRQHEAPAIWEEHTGSPDKLIAKFGKASDVIVFDRSISKRHGHYQNVIQASLLETGKPVIIIPSNHSISPGRGLVDRVSVAWDGGARVVHAVAMALPLLSIAQSVSILTVGRSKANSSSVRELMSYLETHRINASKVELESGVCSIGESLMEGAVNRNTDLLVMGAFAHHRVRQMIIGGATSFMLDNASLPVFMMH